MLNHELQLIAKIIHHGDFRTVIKNRIKKSMFSTSEGRAYFRFLHDYYHSSKHPGCVPRKSYFQEKFPTFPKSASPKKVTMGELCERLRESALSREITVLNDDVATLAMSDPYRALSLMQDNITKLQAMTASSNNVMLSDMAEELLSEYNLVHKHGGMTGVPLPWKELNKATGGMHEEDFILMYADHKTMKSFIGIMLGVHAYKYAHRRVLYYAAEMNRKLVSRRAAACYCNLDYRSIKRGRLNKGQYSMFEKTLNYLGSWEKDTPRRGKIPRFYIVKDDGSSGKNGLYQLRAEIETFEPDIVIADSYYRMADDYDWKVQANLTKGLKSTAEQYKIPVIGISQRNRSKDKSSGDRGMGDIGYTLAGAQETDLGFRIVYDQELEDGSARIHFIIAAAREVKEKGFTIEFNPYTKNKWVGWLDEEDLEDLSIKQREKKKKRKSVEEEGAVHRATAEVMGQALANMHGST